MSLGISVRGALPMGKGGEGLAGEIAAWLSRRCADTLESAVSAWEEEGVAGLSAELHPCAEPVTIELDGEVRVSANTSSAGPGYHQYVCELIDQLGQRFDVAWAADAGEDPDETGYFIHRDRAKLEARMLRWLAAVGQSLAMHEDDGDSIAVSMSMDHQFDAGAAIVTPLGPRARDWKGWGNGGEVWEADAAREAAGFFAWWDEGETARTRLNRALARMWAQVRWVEPRSEAEARVFGMTLRDLDAAWETDPQLDYPWREWLELCELTAEEAPAMPLLRDRAATTLGPLIGYRRRPVRVLLPGAWNIRIPGTFSETYEEEGGFLAWDERRNLRVSSFSMRCCDDDGHEHELPSPDEMLNDDADAELPPAIEELERWEVEGLVGVGKLFRDEDEGAAYWVLMGKVAGEGRLALCTVCYESESDRAWAEETLRSLRG